MGKKASLFETKRYQVLVLHKKGFFQRKICKKVSCRKKAVDQAIVRFKNFKLYVDKKRSGRPRKTSLHDDNLLGK